jgi:DNA-binding transcriptional ArsR family regulator
MTQDQAPPHQQADITKVAAMAHPVRRRILDLLAAGGPATVGTLAAQSGEQVGNVSHHLKMLRKAGLVEKAPELARDRRESWWRAVTMSWSWSITDFAGDPAGEVVAMAAEQEQLRSNVEKTQRWYEGRSEIDPAWIDAAFSSTSSLKLTLAELAELGAMLSGVVAGFAASHVPPDPAAGSVAEEDDDRRPVFVYTYGFPLQP